MAGVERRTPTRRPAGAVLARGEPSEPRVSPGQRKPEGQAAEGFRSARPATPHGHGCNSVLNAHRARGQSCSLPAWIEDCPALPVRTDAACRQAALLLPSQRHSGPVFLAMGPGPFGGLPCCHSSSGVWPVAVLRPAPRSPSRRERRSGTGCVAVQRTTAVIWRRGSFRTWLRSQTQQEAPAGPQLPTAAAPASASSAL
jgi:hypothetical protein